MSEDEEYKKVNFDKFKSLRPVFQKEGGILYLFLVNAITCIIFFLYSSDSLSYRGNKYTFDNSM